MISDIEIEKIVDEILADIINIRRDFHMYPELSEKEFKTRDKIIGYLESMEIENSILASTGVVGILEGKGEKTVAIRADIDALPIQDRKNIAYASKIPNVMHACGHDVHTSIVLGVAKVLKKIENELKGNIKFIFQPAEETVGGAKPMIEEGVLKNPDVDHIFGLHVDNSIECGKIGVKHAQMKASSEEISIRVYGKSSHGAYPQDGIDAIYISSSIIMNLQSIIGRTLDPRRSGVVSIGKIEGGSARNIISNYVEMEGIVRTLDEDSRTRTLERLKTIVEGTAESLGGRAELYVNEGYTYLINDRATLEMVEKNVVDILGEDSLYYMEYPSFGVEDFAFFTREIPGAFFNLGTGNKSKGIESEAHTEYFDIDENAIKIGIMLQVKNILLALEK